jgi:hypothetical protein
MEAPGGSQAVKTIDPACDVLNPPRHLVQCASKLGQISSKVLHHMSNCTTSIQEQRGCVLHAVPPQLIVRDGKIT